MKGPYVKVYQAIVDDPMFARVYDSPVLATWLRMLMVADAMYPASAPIGRRNSDVRLLIEVGLVIERPGNRYSMRGLEAERERRSAIGRNAAAVRYQSERNADPLLTEQSKAEQNRGNGHSPTTFMGFKPKAVPPSPADLADIERQQAASLEDAIRKTAERSRGPAEPDPREGHGG